MDCDGAARRRSVIAVSQAWHHSQSTQQQRARYSRQAS